MRLPTFALVISIGAALPFPGLLRVPKVYNALITSNQNLSPSRAFPVIQPVVHRTAVGYVPPFYYNVPPFVSGQPLPVPQSPLLLLPGDSRIETMSATPKPEGAGEKSSENGESTPDSAENPEKNAQAEQLRFYPNYHSLHYDPYFNVYRSFNAFGGYYVDYQTPKSEEQSPGRKEFQEEKPSADAGEMTADDEEDSEKVPDAPPPPLPTAVPKEA
ncbi:uncharacterized protein LOC105699613 [Orussus abietinus]|uniref:uncharacterized protein LOC105699613 n=1 Tax=Orussus abietinus TaxID=222816 RepID=UPI000625EADC|nr:uncharacterized protein LOC105699613 [Orussus abietinus]